jgi:hypothetical protein
MAKPEIVNRAGRTETPRLAEGGWRSTLLGTYSAVSCSVCFAFDGRDKVRGEKVYNTLSLGARCRLDGHRTRRGPDRSV